jgi:hypothetical protein
MDATLCASPRSFPQTEHARKSGLFKNVHAEQVHLSDILVVWCLLGTYVSSTLALIDCQTRNPTIAKPAAIQSDTQIWRLSTDVHLAYK